MFEAEFNPSADLNRAQISGAAPEESRLPDAPRLLDEKIQRLLDRGEQLGLISSSERAMATGAQSPGAAAEPSAPLRIEAVVQRALDLDIIKPRTAARLLTDQDIESSARLQRTCDRVEYVRGVTDLAISTDLLDEESAAGMGATGCLKSDLPQLCRDSSQILLSMAAFQRNTDEHLAEAQSLRSIIPEEADRIRSIVSYFERQEELEHLGMRNAIFRSINRTLEEAQQAKIIGPARAAEFSPGADEAFPALEQKFRGLRHIEVLLELKQEMDRSFKDKAWLVEGLRFDIEPPKLPGSNPDGGHGKRV